MKKNIALILAIIMALSLCACGNKSSSSSENSSSSTQGASVSSESTPEYVYKSQFKTLASKTRVNYVPQVYTDKGIYSTGNETVGSSAPEGVVEEYFGQYDITEPRIFFIDYSGKVNKLPNYLPVEKEEAEENQYDFDCYQYLSGLNINSNGNIVVLEVSSISYMDEEGITYDDAGWSDHYHWFTKYYIRELDSTGAELSRSLFQLDGSDYMYCECVLDKDGNLLASKSTESGENSIIAITMNGDIAYEIPTNDYIQSIVSTTNGDCYVILWGNNGLEMCPIDFSSGKLGESIVLPSDAYSVYSGGGDYQLYYTSGVNFYGFNPGDESATKLFNWMDCDINPDYLYKLCIMDDGTIRTISSDFDNYDMVYNIDLVDIAKTEYDPNTAKQEITLATQYLEWELQNAVIDFNRKHDDVRIKVIDYSQYNTEDDYSAGQNKLTTEIIAGNAPDIIALSGLPTSQFAAKGVIEDLYPYLENDPELNISDYYQNILKAGEYNGKLVRTITSFSLSTVAGASQLVGDMPGWTYKDFNLALKELQSNVEGATAFDATTTRADILSTCLCLDMQDFVNWETGKVDFNNEEFYSLLEFAKSFPTAYDWENYDWQNDSAEARISQGRQLLWRDSISSTDSLMYLESCFNGTDITFVGYPTNNGVGSMILLDSGYAMSSNCKNKDAAWEFLREMFTEKYYYQHSSYSGLSPIKAVLEKSLKDATTVKYQIGSDGQYVLDDNGDRIPQERYMAIGTDLHTYYALSEGLAQSFKDAVESCTKVYDYNSSIIDIVSEEAEAFFQNQKSVENVAKLIQSKVNIYVNEQR